MSSTDIATIAPMSAAVINYHRHMGRWEPDGVGRLQQAALELFGERGFEQTAVADIAERAGLTERTFFRYFTDKREVLFLDSEKLLELFENIVANAPASLAPIDAVGEALQAAAKIFVDRREHASRRQTVIAANPSLQERELMKLSASAAAMARALRTRGVGDPAAILTAEAGVAVFKIAFELWVDPSNVSDLPLLMRETLDQFKSAVGG
jgi:AcrR family transcriptional regulator